MQEQSITPRTFADPEEFGTNTAARLVIDVVEEIRTKLDDAERRLSMYKRLEKENEGASRAFIKGSVFECRKAIDDLKNLLEYAEDTKEYAL